MAQFYGTITGSAAAAIGLSNPMPTQLGLVNDVGSDGNMWSATNTVTITDPISQTGFGTSVNAALAGTTFNSTSIKNVMAASNSGGSGTCAPSIIPNTVTGSSSAQFNASNSNIATATVTQAQLDALSNDTYKAIAVYYFSTSVGWTTSYNIADMVNGNFVGGPTASAVLQGCGAPTTCSVGIVLNKQVGGIPNVFEGAVGKPNIYVVEYNEVPVPPYFYGGGSFGISVRRASGFTASDASIGTTQPAPVGLICIPCCQSCLGFPF